MWKFVTVALTGQPNGDTWGGLPDDKRAGAETWIQGSYDPVLNLTYWGTAQAKPWRRDLRGSQATGRPIMPIPPSRWMPTPAS